MWSVTLKLMKTSAKVLVPAGIAILIGTMFIANTLLFGNTLDYSMRQQISANYGDANYTVTQASNGTSAYGTVDDFHVDEIRQIDGVRGVRPDVSAYVEMTKDDVHYSGMTISTVTPATLMPIELTQGDWPDGDEIAIPDSAAELLGVGVGDTVEVASYSEDTFDLTVSGITEDPNNAYSYYGGASAVDETMLGTLYGMDGGAGIGAVDCYGLYLSIDESDGGVDSRTLDDISALAPDGYELMDRATSEERTLVLYGGGETNVITTFMLVFGVLAMFVAAMVIANTFQVLVAQRRRTLALLRTIGAKKRQLYLSVVAEAMLLGLIASLAAVAASIGVMQVIGMCGVRFEGIEFHTVLTPQVFIVPIGFGVVVTVLASLSSARTATSVTPLEALQPLEFSERGTAGRVRLIVALAMTAVGAAVTAFTVVDTWRSANGAASLSADNGTMVLLMAMAGVMVFFLGVLLCANRWVPLVLRGVGALVSLIGPSSTIASANIQKNPRRVAATSSALLIGVALVATLGTGAACARQTFAAALDGRYSVDIQISGEGVDRSMLDTVRDVDGVAETELVAVNEMLWDSDDDMSSVMQTYALTEQQARTVMNGDAFDELADGVLLMPGAVVDAAGYGDELADGATVSGTFNPDYQEDGTADGTPLDLTVHTASFRGLYSGYWVYGLVTPATLDDAGITPDGYEVWVKTDGSVEPADLINELQNALSSYEGVYVSGAVAERVAWDEMVNMLLLVLVALLAVAVIISLIGVANTLSLSVIERTRESATLRAIGMTRGQLRRSLAVEALLIAVVSGVVGVLLGTVFGWIGSYIVFTSFTSGAVDRVMLVFDWTTAGVILLVAVVAALLASVFPARRAVRTPPVEALAEA